MLIKREHALTDVEDEASASEKYGKQGNMYNIYTPKVFLRVQDEHDVNSMCIYFKYLAVCITLIAKPTCIYFRFSAVCITLIAIFLCTLLHLAGY